MKPAYVESLGLIERLHRHFLEVVRGELERMDEPDINNVQSLILFNMGQDKLSVGELTSRGYYLGTNVGYNLKKLIESGYVCQRSSPHDRRSVRVSLTDKGFDLRDRLEGAFERHAAMLRERSVCLGDFEQMIATLGALGRAFTDLTDSDSAGFNMTGRERPVVEHVASSLEKLPNRGPPARARDTSPIS